MTVELRTPGGRLIGRIETETWQAPPAPATTPQPNPNQKQVRKP